MNPFPNKYAKPCSVCRKVVGVSEGFCGRVEGNWVTWCKGCLPVAVPAQQRLNVRTMTAAGRVIMDYDPTALCLLRSLPGAHFNQDDKSWSFSLAEADRKRVLEVGERLRCTSG